MNRFLQALLGIGLALGGCCAMAHEAHHTAPPAAPAAGVKGTHDARTWFTDTTLLNQDGEAVRFYSDVLEDQVVLINIIFTRCNDACPLITRKLKEVRDALGSDAERVRFVSLSSDPGHDTPQTLKAYAQLHGADHANWVFLTGDAQPMSEVLGRLGQLSRTPEEHSTLLLAGDVANKRWSRIRPDAPVAAIAQRLRLMTLPAAAPAS